MKQGDILTDGKNDYMILGASGSLFWLSQPNDFENGWRCFSVEDLAATDFVEKK